MNRPRPDLSTAPVIVAALEHLADITVTEALIRQWASRGHITRHGKGHRGAVLYDPKEVLRHAQKTVLHEEPKSCHTEASSACPFSEGGPAGAANSPGPGPTSWSRT